MTNTKKQYDIVEFLDEKGISTQDNICVFCSIRMDRWDSICRNCKEYKGVMNIVDAVEYYGEEIIGY
jgi:hypothetical protein